MITALLNLQKSPGMAFKPIHQMAGNFFYSGNIAHLAGRQQALCQLLPASRLQLVMIAQNLIHLWHNCPVLRGNLGGTAGYQYHRAGLLAAQLADFLARLFFGLGSNRTGIDNNSIGQPGRIRMAAHHL